MVSFALRQRRDQYIIRSNTAPVHTHKPMRMRYLTTLLSRLFSFPPLEHVLRLGLWPFVFLITIHDRAPLTGVLLYLSLSLAHTWMRRHRAGYTYQGLTIECFCLASLGIWVQPAFSWIHGYIRRSRRQGGTRCEGFGLDNIWWTQWPSMDTVSAQYILVKRLSLSVGPSFDSAASTYFKMFLPSRLSLHFVLRPSFRHPYTHLPTLPSWWTSFMLHVFPVVRMRCLRPASLNSYEIVVKHAGVCPPTGTVQLNATLWAASSLYRTGVTGKWTQLFPK